MKGDTIELTTTTNHSGYLLQIYLPNDQLYYNQTHQANTTIPFTIPVNAPYGTYTVKSLIPDQETTTWLTVLNIMDWDQITSFPHIVQHNGLTYSFNANWTLTVNNGIDSLTVDFDLLQKLKNKYNLEVIPRNNSMNVLIRFKKDALNIKVDLNFAFIHKGCKIIINGTMDQARTCTFNMSTLKPLKKLINSVKVENLIFDWSDVKKAGQQFSFSNDKLHVEIPQTFRLDPVIFEDGFESEVPYSEWTGTTVDASNTLEVQSNIVYEGVNASRHILVASHIEDPSYCYYDLPSGDQTDLNMRLYLYLDEVSLSASNRYFRVLILRGETGAGSDYIYLGVEVVSETRNLRIRYRTSADYQTNTSATTLDLDTWYCIEAEFHEGDGNGSVLVYLNDEEVEDLTNTGLDNDVWTGIDSVQCGSSGGYINEVGSYATFITDGVVVDDEYIGLIVTNYTPVNDACTITNMNDTDNLYAQINLGYSISYDGHDDDTYFDIDYVFINLTQADNIRVSFKYTNSSNTFSIQSGSSEFTLDGSSSASRSGDFINLTIIFHVQWDATEEADLELNCTIADDEPTYDHDNMQTDYCDIVTNLLTSSIECTDANNPDRVDVSSSITIDFSVRYANDPGSSTATTYYPPNTEFTSVAVYDDEDNTLGTDNSIVNGDGQITGTSRATVRQTYYNLYVNMADADYVDGEETPNEEVISDQIKILTFGANDTRLDLNGIIELYATSELEYDSHAMGSGDSLTIDGIALSWTIDNFNGTDTESIVMANVYNSGVGSEATYGITVVNMDGNSVSVIWDRILVSFGVDDTTPNNNVTVTFTVTLTREYDSSSVSSYIYDVNRNSSLFIDDRSTSTFTDVNSSIVFLYDFISVTDQTYDLTGFVDPSNIMVMWGFVPAITGFGMGFLGFIFSIFALTLSIITLSKHSK